MIIASSGDVVILETERLRVRPFSTADAEFILRLLNEPSFIANIGNKGIRTIEDATSYLVDGPMASYQRFGFGLWRVALKDSSVPIGMCGLLKRDFLEDVDIGYAFLPEHCSLGYALEVSSAVMRYAREQLGLDKVVAIVNDDNTRSIRLLEKLGFRYERTIRLADDDKEVQLLASVG
jgi:[ribosomal protein S5]-alanine N-acetyltransferase